MHPKKFRSGQVHPYGGVEYMLGIYKFAVFDQYLAKWECKMEYKIGT